MAVAAVEYQLVPQGISGKDLPGKAFEVRSSQSGSKHHSVHYIYIDVRSTAADPCQYVLDMYAWLLVESPIVHCFQNIQVHLRVAPQKEWNEDNAVVGLARVLFGPRARKSITVLVYYFITVLLHYCISVAIEM